MEHSQAKRPTDARTPPRASHLQNHTATSTATVAADDASHESTSAREQRQRVLSLFQDKKTRADVEAARHRVQAKLSKPLSSITAATGSSSDNAVPESREALALLPPHENMLAQATARVLGAGIFAKGKHSRRMTRSHFPRVPASPTAQAPPARQAGVASLETVNVAPGPSPFAEVYTLGASNPLPNPRSRTSTPALLPRASTPLAPTTHAAPHTPAEPARSKLVERISEQLDRSIRSTLTILRHVVADHPELKSKQMKRTSTSIPQRNTNVVSVAQAALQRLRSLRTVASTPFPVTQQSHHFNPADPDGFDLLLQEPFHAFHSEAHSISPLLTSEKIANSTRTSARLFDTPSRHDTTFIQPTALTSSLQNNHDQYLLLPQHPRNSTQGDCTSAIVASQTLPDSIGTTGCILDLCMGSSIQ
ncbi:hypothetical protein CAOG_04736 [Capsaspora owczarzaki ATCC 30864]|uniref:hypothetical protein n=1 Tax=Capsaspora owczarzaki (strain ATCC 30864) TaxID=595528 RepID=UPI00035210E1|nr:hypothetical protein CAOG_04736 [Capsaspora owczarzaki ATCC 30864]|eukprot:XP_004347484.2 hypothetical protein CAOG_04736 [Capsaspora owczarzaki ATCC 30864]